MDYNQRRILERKNLADGKYNLTVEAAVSTYLEKPWKIEEVTVFTKIGMHGAAKFTGNGFSAFVKIGTNSFSNDQFKQEAQGLITIRNYSDVYAPEVIGLTTQDEATLLIMEYIDAREPETKNDWNVMGSGLATLHKSTWNYCGLKNHSYLGIFRQNNTPTDNWPDFFGEHRLRDTMQMAIDANNITPQQVATVERLIAKLPEICGPKQPFSLLHGDPWIANLLFDGKRLVLIDCGIYYGNREIDLSTVAFFRPVHDYFFDAYHECYPIDPGYKEREDLWRINQLLGHVALFGEDHHKRLMNTVNKYL